MALWPNNRTDILGRFPVGISGYLAFQEVDQRVQRRLAYFAGDYIEESSSVPEGSFGSAANILPPIVGGGMSSANSATDITLSQAGNLLAGGPVAGNLTFGLDQTGGLSLQVTLAGGSTAQAGQSGNLALTIGLAASAGWTLTAAGGLSMIVPVAGAGVFALAGDANLKGNLSLSGDITPFTTLSPENLALAVWSATASENNTVGTMGQKLNLAGSGGVDNDALAAAVWAYMTRTLTGIADANVKQVNDIDIDGSGTEGDPWGPV